MFTPYALKTQNLELHDFNRIAEHITKKYGIKMPLAKKSMVESRLFERLGKHNFNSYGHYVDFLFSREGKEELRNLKEYLSTNETWFFREPEHFKYLKTYLKRRDIPKKLRIWSSASSSGQEPYSIAMTLEDLKESDIPELDYKIWCSDISKDILEKATLGIYTPEQIENIKTRYVEKYFDLKDPKKPQIIKDIRNRLLFKQFNLISESDYRSIAYKFDIIFCRNVLIYFNMENQEKVIKSLTSKLKPGGLFMIGHTETSIIKKINNLKLVRPALYEKTC